jgi:preprotein translocase subunit YajC
MITHFFTFLADNAPATPQQPPSGSMFIPMLCFGVIMYFLLIRPQQKKQKELQNLVSGLKTGDKVVTNGGIHGIVSNVKDGPTLSLKIADNVKIEVDKSAIVTVDRSSNASTTPAAANS